MLSAGAALVLEPALAAGGVGGALGLLARGARAETPPSSELVQHDLELEGDRRIARRALVLEPAQRSGDAELSILILLHGLGEMGNETLGIHAWGERYGLVRAYERLRQPPIERILPQKRYLTDEHRARLNESLKRRPFGGLVLVCPVTPHPSRSGPTARTLAAYADWIEGELLPKVRRQVPRAGRRVGLDGCSLGGYVSWEVFLRKPELFASVGSIQAAIGQAAAPEYARRIAAAIEKVGPRPIHLESSTQDPYRKANERLHRELAALGVPSALSVPPGPHDQPWLREVGTLELLLWHERQLGARP